MKIRRLKKRVRTAQDPATELKQTLNEGEKPTAEDDYSLGPLAEEIKKQTQKKQQEEQERVAPPESAEEELKNISNRLNQAELPKAVEDLWKGTEKEFIRSSGRTRLS